jgi:hypothetical protein
MILSRVDGEMTGVGSGLTSQQIYHNIDDYQIGCLDVSSAENAQSKFVRTIARYELRLNDFKTSIDHGLQYRPYNFQRFLDILSDSSGRSFVEHFFELLYQLESQYPQVNVIGYALKRFARPLARNSEKGLVREYLQRLMFAAPHQARWIFPLLLGLNRNLGVTADARRLIHWGIETCARRNDVGSLLWYIYAAIFLNVRLSSAHCYQCIGIANPLVDVMLYHGRSIGVFTFDVSTLRQRHLDSPLSSDAWVVLYEVERRGWDAVPAFSKIGTSADPVGLYDHLRTNNVEFYITDQGRFAVDAFAGWNLTQSDFDGAPLQQVFHIEDFLDEYENYD